jgi:DNA helicase-2/ATP-dependent DNA helicase PcrA
MNQSFLEELNPAQRAAAEVEDGPVLVLAGAGSGKTKTLVARIAFLLQKGVFGSQILAVTFTNKAAKEMRQRLGDLLGGGDLALPFLGTFHGICVRILRKEAANIGIASNFVIYDDGDRNQLIKQILKNNLRLSDTKQARPVLSLISKFKNDGLDASDLEFAAKTPIEKITAEAWPIYSRRMNELGALDFDDLILKTVELFAGDEDLRREYQFKFKYILVDEYQDTNPVQYKLLKLLVNENQNIFVVGDDWQSIYSWRGADYKIILNFEVDYPNAKLIKLEENYRSSQNILDAAHKIITKNSSRSNKKLFTSKGAGEKVELLQASSESHEADLVLNTVQDLRSNEDYQFKDFVVLYRTNAQSRSFEESCMRRGIPYQIIGGLRFYERKEVKDLLAYLRFIYNCNDAVAFERIINTPTRGIGAKSLSLILESARQVGSLESALNSPLNLSGKAAKSLADFWSRLKKVKLEAQKLSVAELIEVVIAQFSLDSFYDDSTPQGMERVENLRELVSVAAAQGAVDLGQFLEDVALVSDLDNMRSDGDCITLMTIHGAKGLEFPVVFVAGLEEGVFPHSRSNFSQEELEEERRLAYVAMTRARERLYLVYATRRLIFGGTQFNPPSRFVTELMEEGIVSVMNPIASHTNLLFGNSGGGSGMSFGGSSQSSFGSQSLFAEAEQVNKVLENPKKPESLSLNEGSKVRHPKFGIGTVVELNEPMATIVFSGKPVQIHLEYAPLSLA